MGPPSKTTQLIAGLSLALLLGLPSPADAEQNDAAPPSPAREATVKAVAGSPDAWARLSAHAGWKVAGLTFSFSVVSFASDYDRPSSAWARERKPLGKLSVIGDDSPPFMLGGTLGLLGGLALLGPEEARPGHARALEVFTVSQLINAGLTDLLKSAVARPRPDSGARSSFPSGHTSSAAAWATLLWRRYGWKAGLPASLFAAFVGLSRIQDGRHYLSDVLAGAVLGVSVTYVVDALYGP